jgi:serine protease Do
MAGGGLFDLEGRLLGVVLPCADRMAAVTADAVERIRTSLQATDENADLAMRYGLGLSPLDENEARYFGRAEGLLVREVWDGSFAARAGVAPGDVVVAIGDRPIDSAGAFLSAAPESAPITIRRGRTTMRLPIAPQAGALGLQLTPGTSLRVDRVFEGSTAAAAGLQEGDRLLRVDSAAADDEAATRRRLARVDAPHWLEVQRGRRRIGMLLRPEARR